MFKIEKVSTDKHGGCYNCKDSKWNDEIQNIEYKDKEVNQFVIGNTIIRLCDKCLKELKESIDYRANEIEDIICPNCGICNYEESSDYMGNEIFICKECEYEFGEDDL